MAEKTKNILFLADNGDIIGGTEQSLTLLLDRLDRDSYRPHVVFFYGGRFSDYLRRRGVPVTVIRLLPIERKRFLQMYLYPFYFASLLYGIFRLVLFIKKHDIRIVHNNKVQSVFYAAFSSWLCRVPMIWHERCLKRRIGLFGAMLVKLSSKVVAISDAVGRGFLSYLDDPGKLVTIYNGVDPAVSPISKNEARSRFELPEEVPVVATACRITDIKGLDTFIEAASRVLATHPEVLFLICGESYNRADRRHHEHLRAMIRDMGLADRVKLTGWVEPLDDVFSAVDLFVLPSLKEAFGRVLIEAMAFRTPVIGTVVGGIPEIIIDSETGLLVEPGDPGALAESISRLLEDRKMAGKMAENGRRRIEQCFPIEKHVREVQNLYRELLN
ncbi:MAG: glycosyltransferase family 4 protein [bacterium]|nr:glycosyltransferase family 4 protein [bacterium]